MDMTLLATKTDIAELRTEMRQEMQNMRADTQAIVDKAVGDLTDIMSSFMQQTHEQLMEIRHDIAALTKRVERLGKSVAEIKADVAGLYEKTDNLAVAVDQLAGKYDQSEIERAERSIEFRHLVKWAREVAKKTGVPLRHI